MKRGKIILCAVTIAATIGSALTVTSYGNRFGQGTLFTKADGTNCNPTNCRRALTGPHCPAGVYYTSSNCQNSTSPNNNMRVVPQ